MVSVLGDYYYDFPKKMPLKLRLKDMLEDKVDESFYLSEKAVKGIEKTSFSSAKLENRTEKDGIAPTLMARDYKDPKLVVENDQENLTTTKNKPIRVGFIPYPNSEKAHQSNSVYSTQGTCPTIDTCGGGNREPKIVEDISGRMKDNFIKYE
jgi:DNA (cytosine-5)-methyltransferase 1